MYDQTSTFLEYDEDGLQVAKYDYGSDRLISQTRASGTQFYSFDALRSVTNLSDSSGSVAASYHLDAWGQYRFPSELNASANRFGFTGYLFDPETDFYYARARYYDAEYGRFTSQDPLLGTIDTPPSLHRYLYAFARPTVLIDPTGLDPRIEGTFRTPEGLEVATGSDIGDLRGATAEDLAFLVERGALTEAEARAIAIGNRVSFLASPPQSEKSADRVFAETFAVEFADRAIPGLSTYEGLANQDPGQILRGAGEQGAAGALGLGAKVGVPKLVERFPILAEDAGVLARQGLRRSKELAGRAASRLNEAAQGLRNRLRSLFKSEDGLVPATGGTPGTPPSSSGRPTAGFERYVEAEASISRTPKTLAEVEDALRLNAGMADDATRAAKTPRTRGRFGTRAHTRFEGFNDQLNQQLQQSGSSFRVAVEEFRGPTGPGGTAGTVVGRRAAESKGVDAVVYENGIPVRGFDLKTGRPWSADKLAEVQRRFGVDVTQIGTR